MMWREELIGDCRLICGNCRDVLPTISRVDAVICDPPFDDEAHAANRRLLSIVGTKRRGLVKSPLSFDPLGDDVREFIATWSARNCRGWAIAFCQVEAVGAWRMAFDQAGAKWRRGMVWVKPDSSPQLSGDRPAQGFESIAAAWCGEGGSTWNGGGRRGVFIVGKHDPGNGHGGAKNVHETQKPTRLMIELVQLFSNEGDTVLDPFMGSGTTGVASAKRGRKFIGVELDERYFEIACRRIQQAYEQPDFFVGEVSSRHEQLPLIEAIR